MQTYFINVGVLEMVRRGFLICIFCFFSDGSEDESWTSGVDIQDDVLFLFPVSTDFLCVWLEPFLFASFLTTGDFLFKSLSDLLVLE